VTESAEFGRIVLIVAAAFALAVAGRRITEWVRVPAPGLFLVGAAVASAAYDPLGRVLSVQEVERVGVVAIILILFDGGIAIGLERLRRVIWPVLLLGVLGTLLVAGIVACAAHGLLGLPWTPSLLLGGAIAPTDPAVMFSVLGGRDIHSPAGDIVKGESGANDPVSIALVLGVLAYRDASSPALGVAGSFGLEMVVGLAVGVLGGLGLRQAIRRFALPDEELYPLRTLAGAGVVYGLASVLHGSGFLAVFVAGVLIGDARAPYKAAIERFHTSLGTMAEIVVFTALGLTIALGTLDVRSVLLDGALIALVVTLVARPLVVALLLLRAGLSRAERVYAAWAGMKGAVPILLGAFVLLEQGPDARRLYGMIFVVVVMSVFLQGTTIEFAARRLGIVMTPVEQEPWDLSLRFTEEPQGVRRYTVEPGAPADGTAIRDLDGDGAWVSMVIRDGAPLTPHRDTVLHAGDEVLLLDAGDESGIYESDR
jgi:cell volume regulation protein A